MSEQTNTPLNAETLLEHGQRLTRPLEPPMGFSGRPALLAPAGWSLVQPPWKPLRPDRITATVNLADASSFTAYVNRFRGDGTLLFLASDTPTFLAVIDAPKPLEPDWAEHQAVFAPRYTRQWKAWRDTEGEAMNQAQFARFVEKRAQDIASPSGADLLGIVNNLEIAGTVQFQSAQRLQDGAVQFRYVEERTAKAGAVEVPATFGLRLAVFEGEKPVSIQARLRYRMREGELSIWHELALPDELVEYALESMARQIGSATGLAVLRGAPCFNNK
ncbi:MAG: YfdQ family protein [Armatimonadetes bacterium]|nr:YfdQ family protein [Armatimonadota bacterium]